ERVDDSFPQDHSPACEQPLVAGRGDHPRPKLRPLSEKEGCRGAPTERDPRGRWPAHPQRLRGGPALLRRHLPQAPPIPHSTATLARQAPTNSPEEARIVIALK